MCGFVGYLGDRSIVELEKNFGLIAHRGPDHTDFKDFNGSATLWFHRLAINGLNNSSNQPMNLETSGGFLGLSKDPISDLWLVCNGEIYNHQDLAEKYKVETTTGSDLSLMHI